MSDQRPPKLLPSVIVIVSFFGGVLVTMAESARIWPGSQGWTAPIVLLSAAGAVLLYAAFSAAGKLESRLAQLAPKSESLQTALKERDWLADQLGDMPGHVCPWDRDPETPCRDGMDCPDCWRESARVAAL
jgi:hypothetical protein